MSDQFGMDIIVSLEAENKQLGEQVKVLEKALELALNALDCGDGCIIKSSEYDIECSAYNNRSCNEAYIHEAKKQIEDGGEQNDSKKEEV